MQISEPQAISQSTNVKRKGLKSPIAARSVSSAVAGRPESSAPDRRWRHVGQVGVADALAAVVPPELLAQVQGWGWSPLVQADESRFGKKMLARLALNILASGIL